MRRRPIVLLLPLAAVAAGACGEDRDLADDLVEVTDGALDADQAACVADGLESSFGDDSFRALDDADEAVRLEVIDIFAACDALDAVLLDG